MLTKSAAKTFFLGGTLVTGGAFLLLTLDTLKQFPERSNQSELTEEVKHGFEIWTNNNCMGCHTLMGEGGYYAPELTLVVDRRGEEWIRAFLKNPESFYPGRRKMVKYDIFDPAEDPEAEKNISDVIEFFEWVAKIDMNGYPATPDLGVVSTASASTESGSTVMATTPQAAHNGSEPVAAVVDELPSAFATCKGCHIVGGSGGNVGPSLDDVSDRMTFDEIATFIADPSSVRPETTMPNLGLTDSAVTEITTYLTTKN